MDRLSPGTGLKLPAMAKVSSSMLRTYATPLMTYAAWIAAHSLRLITYG